MLKQLRANGIRRIVMLTGDHPDIAEVVAGELGIDEWRAEVQVRLPTLGVVDITFQARQATALRVEIDPSEAPTRDRVRRELEPLRQRLTALGIQAEIALGASHHER